MSSSDINGRFDAFSIWLDEIAEIKGSWNFFKLSINQKCFSEFLETPFPIWQKPCKKQPKLGKWGFSWNTLRFSKVELLHSATKKLKNWEGPERLFGFTYLCSENRHIEELLLIFVLKPSFVMNYSDGTCWYCFRLMKWRAECTFRIILSYWPIYWCCAIFMSSFCWKERSLKPWHNLQDAVYKEPAGMVALLAPKAGDAFTKLDACDSMPSDHKESNTALL